MTLKWSFKKYVILLSSATTCFLVGCSLNLTINGFYRPFNSTFWAFFRKVNFSLGRRLHLSRLTDFFNEYLYCSLISRTYHEEQCGRFWFPWNESCFLRVAIWTWCCLWWTIKFAIYQCCKLSKMCGLVHAWAFRMDGRRVDSENNLGLNVDHNLLRLASIWQNCLFTTHCVIYLVTAWKKLLSKSCKRRFCHLKIVSSTNLLMSVMLLFSPVLPLMQL